jgi:hypothetical protein
VPIELAPVGASPSGKYAWRAPGEVIGPIHFENVSLHDALDRPFLRTMRLAAADGLSALTGDLWVTNRHGCRAAGPGTDKMPGLAVYCTPSLKSDEETELPLDALHCAGGVPHTHKAIAWSTACGVIGPPASTLAKTRYECGAFDNVVPTVVTTFNASLVQCDLDPTGNSSCTSQLNAMTNADGNFPNGTLGQPGIHVLQVAEDTDFFQNAWLDDIGPPPGAPTACEDAPMAGVCRTEGQPWAG